ncbi:MAG: CBS domain-containing protein [Candidatus Omnitrophica bacterium]|nr:CBS domain-containing protein [Candidatus Omnitrophota bacterium]MDD5080918.1 CBS domain-containing protein [Candidatus Omnitrophota bacterium]
MERADGFKSILLRGVVEANEETTAKELAILMADHNIGAIAITTDEKLVGIVSERDIVLRIVAKGLDPDKVCAKEFMTKDVKTAEFKDGLDKIYKMLCMSKFRHIPILNDGKLVGIASQRDALFGVMARQQSKESIKDCDVLIDKME